MCSMDGQMCVLEIHTMERKMLDFLGFSWGTVYSFMCAGWSK